MEAIKREANLAEWNRERMVSWISQAKEKFEKTY